ncbi:MAG: hypothetical protein ACRD9W_22495, partial [Terriglobia bacterium]
MHGSNRVDRIIVSMLRIGLAQSLLKARLNHGRQCAKSAVPLPIHNKPLQIERSAGQEPEIRSRDGVNKWIGIANAVGGREGTYARFVQRGHQHHQRRLTPLDGRIPFVAVVTAQRPAKD